jgi:hypothetical protein
VIEQEEQVPEDPQEREARDRQDNQDDKDLIGQDDEQQELIEQEPEHQTQLPHFLRMNPANALSIGDG